MGKSQLETEVKKSDLSLWNNIPEPYVQLAGYLVERAPMDKKLIIKNCLVYSHF